MRSVFCMVVAGLAVLATSGILRAASEPPAWAYAVIATPRPPAAPGAAAPAVEDESTPRHLAGTTRTFTIAQIDDNSNPADWFPEDHPAMPDIVAHGRKPGVNACAFCHMPNGQGRPSNAPVSGLPVSYFVQTLNDFKNGLRKPAESRKANVNQMIAFAKAMTPAEMQAAAEYFAAVKRTPWIRVVETATVPKTRITGSIYFRLPGNETEPLGLRIVETPENVHETEELRNPRSGFIAYAPPGSIKKGEALVTTGGNGKTVQCGVCHGADLKGLGPVPSIAGRSPSYLVRQMYDMQAGTRHGAWTDLMKPVVARLTDEDFVTIAAYLGSRTP